MHPKFASFCGLAGAGLFMATALVGGWLLPGYNAYRQFISESYALGTPYGPVLRFAGYLPAGLLMAAFAGLAARALPKSAAAGLGFAGLGIFYGLGTVAVSFFPCSAGCGKAGGPPELTQIIHNLLGMLTYLTVPASLLLLGLAARRWPQGAFISVAGFACGAGAFLFAGGIASPAAGLFQRLSEGCILGYIILCSVYLWRLRR